MIRLPALCKGDTIGVMAPSSRVDRAKVETGVAALKSLGYGVYVHPQTFKKRGSSAGTAKEKAKALHDLFKNPEIKAILCARGGNRAGTMLPHLDFNLIRKHPKAVMGYSDITALLNAIYAETGLVGFHGPMLHGIGGGKPNKRQIAQGLALLSGEAADIPMPRAKVLRPGTAKGRLVGGNLSLICSLMGTKWQPDFKGALLFLEDCDDELSRYDRMLQQLSNAGVYKQVAGVIFGGFTGNKDSGSLPFGLTMEEIFREALGSAKIPAIMNAPFGHGKDLYTFPVGGIARLKASKQSTTLSIL